MDVATLKDQPVDGWISSQERQVVQMHLAGASGDAIATMLEITTARVTQVLNKPHVQRFILKLQAAFADDIRPTMRHVTDKIAEHQLEAMDTVVSVMREMQAVEGKDRVAARRTALTSAFDILDRAGHKPTQKVEEVKRHSVDKDTLRHMAEVLIESRRPAIPVNGTPVNDD